MKSREYLSEDLLVEIDTEGELIFSWSEDDTFVGSCFVLNENEREKLFAFLDYHNVKD